MQRKKTVILILLLLFIPLFMVIVGEFIQRGSLRQVASWMLHYQSAFLMNYVIALLFLLLIGALFRNVYISLGLYLFMGFFLVLLNKYKMKFLEDPIFPWDLMLYNQVINLFPQLYKAFNPFLLLPLVLIPVLAIYLIRKLPAIRINYKVRIICGILSVILLAGISFYKVTPVQYVLKTLNITNKTWNQNENYSFNGLYLSFLMNVQSAVVLPPNEYNEEKINSIVSAIGEKNPVASASTSGTKVKPNVIFIMNEAFWDPTLLKNVSYSQDPMPTVRSLQNSGNGGWIVSPEYGGGTANVEFEVLTGLSMNFVPSGSVPYQQYITRPTPSLASVFAEKGYDTIAIHPNDKWFWNRDVVYKHFGFNSFLSIDQFNNPSKSKRETYVDDTEVTKSIIEQTEKSDKPAFIYAVTIQNHGTYYYPGKNKPEYPIDVKGNFSEEVKEQLHVYSNGVYDGDTELQKLINYYKNSDEPTVIVFFGDHLPYLGTAYDETGYYSSTSGLEQTKSMSKTPLVIWNNFGKEVNLPQDTISTSFLGTYVFDLAGMNTPLYFKFLEEYRSKLPGYKTTLKMDDKGKLYLDTPESLKELENQYRLLQYDLLFGKQYARDKLF